jgi:hypothetical protein
MLLVIFLLSQILFAQDTYRVPKENYLSYEQFLNSNEKKNAPSIRANTDWIQLTHSPPLIGKYQINSTTVLAVSVFDGDIGDEISNINRWRAQLGMAPQNELSSPIKKYKFNKMFVRKINLNFNGKYMLIYWLTTKNRHFFVKTTSMGPIDDSDITSFIESQSWEKI